MSTTKCRKPTSSLCRLNIPILYLSKHINANKLDNKNQAKN